MAYFENMEKTKEELGSKKLNLKCIEKRTLYALKKVDTLVNENGGKFFIIYLYLKGSAQNTMSLSATV